MNNSTHKTCNTCKELLPIEKFNISKHREGARKRAQNCKKCAYIIRNEFNIKTCTEDYTTPKNVRGYNHSGKNQFNTSLIEEYTIIQKGLCWCCQINNLELVDFDRQSNIFRGLVCRDCDIRLFQMLDCDVCTESDIWELYNVDVLENPHAFCIPDKHELTLLAGMFREDTLF